MFNANINYGGLNHAVTAEGWFKENKEKLIASALNSLLQHGALAVGCYCDMSQLKQARPRHRHSTWLVSS